MKLKLCKTIEDAANVKAAEKCDPDSEGFTYLAKYYKVAISEDAIKAALKSINYSIVYSAFVDYLRKNGETIGLDLCYKLAEPYVAQNKDVINYIVIENECYLRFYGNYSEHEGFSGRVYLEDEEAVILFEIL